MQKKKQSIRGFTLLELLVVISIIGILMAMGVVAYSTAQRKGRDAKRRGDIQAIQDAQEQYYAANNGAYASTIGALTTGGYLSSTPSDPRSGNPYYFNYNTTTRTYCTCADVEDNNGNASSQTNPCSFVNTNDGSYFCARNLQ